MPIISSRFVSCAQKGGWRTPVHLYGIIEEMNDSKQAAWGLFHVCTRTFDVWTVLVRSQKYNVGKSTVFFLHAYWHVSSNYHVTIIAF